MSCDPGTILYNINFLFFRFNSFFNWTMTYRLDSDIPEPYGYIESRYSTFIFLERPSL
jgi:hypothetical protein